MRRRATALVPTPPRAPRAPNFTAYDQPLAMAALHSLEKAMGGREAMVAALVAGPRGTPLDYVLDLLADPANHATSLSSLCARGEVSVGELLEAYKRGVTAMAQVAAIHKVAAAIPVIIEDLVNRAQPHYVQCDRCNGVGTVSVEDAAPVPCKACQGKGTHYVLPELDRQKLALDMLKLLPKSALMAVQNNYAAPPTSATPAGHGALMLLVDRVLYPRRGDGDLAGDADPDPDPPLEAEAIPAEPPAPPSE